MSKHFPLIVANDNDKEAAAHFEMHRRHLVRMIAIRLYGTPLKHVSGEYFQFGLGPAVALQ